MRETPPFEWDAGRAGELQPLLQTLLQTMIDWRPA
jgi:N-formylglutamate amidohydrolase